MKHNVFPNDFPEQHNIDTNPSLILILSKSRFQLGVCSPRSLSVRVHGLEESTPAFLPTSVLGRTPSFHPSRDKCLSFLIKSSGTRLPLDSSDRETSVSSTTATRVFFFFFFFGLQAFGEMAASHSVTVRTSSVPPLVQSEHT